ncbi:MAG: multiheme c-type cytochrome, partial [Desulfuromonadaceae bacterium]
WDDFASTKVGGSLAFHRAYTSTAGVCINCHDGSTAKATVSAEHNKANSYTGRGGLLYDGVDISVAEGNKITQTITGVTRTDKNLAITWKATYNGADVNPCNATATTTAPAFAYSAVTASGAQPAVNAQNFSILKAFFQGDDLVNANNGNASPGQANNTALVFTGATPNTVCSGNVATTTITLTDKEAALTGNARVGLQGRPMMVYGPAANRKILVRAKSPVYDFKLADGAAIPARRPVVATDNCLKCHVGSLYQHGGNRIDSVELCVMCHNESSSEQNNRVAYGVTKDEAYDNKVGQTYGFKTMLHAVHASGTAGFSKPLAFYRSNGIYTFALTEAALFNWPGASTAQQTVFGSDPAITRVHNFAAADYPRPLQDCLACHVSNFSRIPDATKAVATTINAGAAPWENQLDDTLQGPAAAACTSCHSSAAVSAHANQFGWTPALLENGRQTVIDLAK